MNAQAYPLQWPAGWPRTESGRTERGVFKTELHQALNNLRREVNLLGGKNLVLSSNCTLGQEAPADPAVCAYFEWQGQHLAVPCDRWKKVSHNVQAIALTIEAMRGMERWGAKHMIKAMFTGFKVLPAPKGLRPWFEVLGVSSNASNDVVQSAWRAQLKRTHPDMPGGSREAYDEVQAAYEHFQKLQPA